jgi:hypothetical protein
MRPRQVQRIVELNRSAVVFCLVDRIWS